MPGSRLVTKQFPSTPLEYGLYGTGLGVVMGCLCIAAVVTMSFLNDVHLYGVTPWHILHINTGAINPSAFTTSTIMLPVIGAFTVNSVLLGAATALLGPRFDTTSN